MRSFLASPLHRHRTDRADCPSGSHLGRCGDLTSDAVIPCDCTTTLVVKARQPGVVAGLDLVAFAFLLGDPAIDMHIRRPDGSDIAAGEIIAKVCGAARGLLTAERPALNFDSHLSGIATATAAIVDAVRDHKTKIVCTRKTTPGLRALRNTPCASAASQSPLRARRRTHQGQPPRDRRRHPHRGRARAPPQVTCSRR